MKRALLISIHPEWAEKILNGEKTIEIRTWIPKDYVGWVYVAITKGKPYICREIGDCLQSEKLNGKVAFRFFVWRENFVKIEWEDDHYFIWQRLLNKSCLTKEELYKYGRKRNLYAWHIENIVIFDKPKELSEFWLDPIDFSIHTRAEALAEGYKPIQKAPQKCAWVYINHL